MVGCVSSILAGGCGQVGPPQLGDSARRCSRLGFEVGSHGTQGSWAKVSDSVRALFISQTLLVFLLDSWMRDQFAATETAQKEPTSPVSELPFMFIDLYMVFALEALSLSLSS